MERSPENHLRLGVALAGAALTLFTIARAGAWPRVLYLACVGYFAYFAAGTAWHSLWQIAEVPADSASERLALSVELAWRVVARQLGSERYALAFSHTYDLAVMPLTQLVSLVYLARVLIRDR